MDPRHLVFNMISFHAFAGFALSVGLPVPTLLALGVGSALASDLASTYDWTRKDQTENAGLGASGVISGIGAAIACTYPLVPFQIMLVPIKFPLWLFAVGYVVYDSYSLNSEGSNIGHAAHLGGSAFGALFHLLFLRKHGSVISLWGASRRRY